MNPILEYKLKRLGRHGKPSRAYVSALKQTLIERGATVIPANAGIQRIGWIPAFAGMTKYAAVALSVVLLLGVGTSTYAYASDEVTPDHPLYAIRQAVEEVEETVAITPVWKERVINKNLERKQQEIGRMLEKNPGLKERPEGVALEKVQSILKKGIEEKRNPDEIREQALVEVRFAERENKNEEHPKAQTRLRKIERRLENMKKVRKED